MLRLVFLFIVSSSMLLHAAYTNMIADYHVDIRIDDSGELDVTETIQAVPGEFTVMFRLQHEIASMLHSRNAIRSVDRVPYAFSVFLNNKPVKWEKRIFHEGSPDKMIRLYLTTDYMEELLTEKEKQEIHTESGPLIYTIHYKVKKSVVKSRKDPSLDMIEWSVIKTGNHIPIAQVEVDLHLPEALTKENVGIDMQYTKKNNSLQITEWKNRRLFHTKIDNLRRDDLFFMLSFPHALLGQTAEKNFDLVLDNNTGAKETFDYRFDRFLLYWQFPAFILYFIFLYYYARSYGSLGAMGPIVVRYKAPDGMSLLQSGVIIDKHADTSDFPAAVIELVSLGYAQIITKGFGSIAYIRQIRKDTGELTDDQRYLLKRILFPGREQYCLSQENEDLYHQFQMLNQKIYTWLEKKGYVYEDFKRTRKRFLFRAFITSIPIIIFSLYITKDLYGERMMFGALVGMYFLTLIIAVMLQRGFGRTWPFLIAIYIIIGVPLYLQTKNSYIVLASTPMLVMPLVYGAMWFFYKKIGIYTGKGLKAYRHLLGYKEFIRRTEVPRLEVMLRVHPDQVEKSLGYAVLFKFIKHPISEMFKINLNADRELERFNYRNGEWRVQGSLNFLWIWMIGIVLVVSIMVYISLK